MSNITRTSLDALSQANFPNNTTQQISPADLKDWIESAVDSFVTQKDTSTFENAFYECKSSTITVAGVGTCNLALATGNFVHINSSGSATITSFGTLPAGSRFILNFEVPVTIQYNATQMILPGGTDIVTAAGDSVMIVSEGSGNWRLIGYFPASGLPVGTVTAVTASAPLSSTGGNAPDISIPQATGSVDGYLSSTDWTTFNNKGSGTVTSITASSPLTGGTITGSGSIGIPKADASTDGYLDNADFATFNGKQDAITLTTTGTSGAATLIGSTLNIPQYSGGGGGTPQGNPGEIQYNNSGAFGGVTDLTYEGTPTPFVVIKNPKIGSSIGNGHLHIHTINATPPGGIADYVTLYVDKSPKQIGARFETDGYTSAFQFGATTNRTYTFPDDSGNVLLDSATQTLTNKTLTSPSITTPAITTPAITGITTIGNGASAGEIRLLEGSAGGSNYTALKAAATLASNYSLTLPVTSPGTGQTLVSDSSGNLSWSSNPGTTGAKFIRTTSVASVTGTTAETLLQQLLIPANTFSAGDGMNIIFRATRTNTATTIYWRFYISDVSGTFSGKPQMSNVNYPNNTALALQAQRNVFISSATATYFTYAGATTTRNTDFSADNFTVSNIDWTIDQYLIMTCQIGNTTGTSTSVGISVSPT